MGSVDNEQPEQLADAAAETEPTSQPSADSSGAGVSDAGAAADTTLTDTIEKPAAPGVAADEDLSSAAEDAAEGKEAVPQPAGVGKDAHASEALGPAAAAKRGRGRGRGARRGGRKGAGRGEKAAASRRRSMSAADQEIAAQGRAAQEVCPPCGAPMFDLSPATQEF